MARADENQGFTSVHCGADVRPLTNGGYRNHCPFCLWSLHVDRLRPGDRDSGCRAPMEPTGIVSGRRGFQIVHTCTRCGKEQRNRVAAGTEQPDEIEILVRLCGTIANATIGGR